MKKLFYLFLIFFPVLMPCGCSDIDDSSLAEYGNNTYIVTDAEVCRYAYGTSTEFEVMLFLDGCSLDSPYGSMVYFGLEFPYSLTGLRMHSACWGGDAPRMRPEAAPLSVICRTV